MFKIISSLLSSALAAIVIGCLIFGILLFAVDELGYENNFLIYLVALLSFILGLDICRRILRFLKNSPTWISLVIGLFAGVFVFGTNYIYFHNINAGSIDLASKAPVTAALPAFPSKPPQASTRVVIPLELLLSSDPTPHHLPRTLNHLDWHLIKALRQIGHTEFSYFSVPSGYALVTRLEKINSDGTPKSDSERWETKLDSIAEFSLERVLRTLFTANKGYYRIIVFIVSPNALIESSNKILEEEAIMWLRQGADRLPKQLAEMQFSDDYACTALVYEFEQANTRTLAHLVSPGKIPAYIHLQASGFYKALGG